jgi:hypothetical protein
LLERGAINNGLRSSLVDASRTPVELVDPEVAAADEPSRDRWRIDGDDPRL